MNMEVVYDYFMQSYLDPWIIEDTSLAERLVLRETQICVGGWGNGFMRGFVATAAVEKRFGRNILRDGQKKGNAAI